MQIQKLNKTYLTLIDSIDLYMSESFGMTVSDYSDSVRTSSDTLPFTLKTSKTQVPILNEVDFAISVRDKVDLSATGPYEKTLKDEDKDTGQHNYKDKVPYRPRALTEGFVELKGEN